MLVIDLKGDGSLISTCDRCLNSVKFNVKPDFKVIAHMNSSEVETVSNDDINLQLIYLRSSDFELNLASSIYESFLTRIINQNEDNQDESVDPRWEKLKQLLNKKEK
jgi:uncharacterized metal-binding protein YceD (DUF177 family)